MTWIRVEDELPAVDQKVLVWNSKYNDPEDVSIGYYDPGSVCPITGWRCGEFMEIYVTHWMPLPKPPEEK